MARVIVGMRGFPPPPELLRAIRRGALAGLLWFRDALGADLAEAAARVAWTRSQWPPGAPCTLAIDEEGGLIQQLCGLQEPSGERWPRLPSARALGRSRDPRLAFAHGREVGRRVRLACLDLALAPVVDLDPGPQSRVLGTRCFDADPERVTEMALAWLRGLASVDVRGCVKHYPGHGATQLDTHHDLPVIPDDADPAPHLLPFERIAAAWRDADGPAPAILTAHVVRGGLGLPASLDPGVLRAIPEGYSMIVTDSLDMGALDSVGGIDMRGLLALEAGSDLLIVGADLRAGLKLARALRDVPPRRRKPFFPRREVPDAWDAAGLARAAEAGLRVLADAPLPEGEWDWILPDGFGPYGAVADPPAGGAGPRRMARVLRYPFGDPHAFARTLAGDGSGRPALVGWIHRGPPDVPTAAAIRAAGARVRAVAHLLDGPAREALTGVWSIETCGFGEAELAALHRRWAEAQPGVESR